ncbi:MAG: selenoneine biosynthesis selenosugar synthase SenB [Gemmatimonadetes bacterium]|nr:selenoneine biosynthesis selenosugar synthase SenB [Gemmatimonadota bacterium]
MTPAPPGSRFGNRVTARRWASLLRRLGHRVVITEEYGGEPCDALVALHARRSAGSVRRFHRLHPERPLILALTGTDVYGDIHTSVTAQQSLQLATRIVVLQPAALEEVPRALRRKCRVIIQSARKPAGTVIPRTRTFDVVVLAHLRPVKDPFLTEVATRYLPASSRIAVLHYGGARNGGMAARARHASATNARYAWRGEVPRWKALRALARSRVLVLTSKLEGGANVVTEAIAASVPVISTRISGSRGLLGKDYPGYFPVGDAGALRQLLLRAESDRRFYAMLKARVKRLAPIVKPKREEQAWRALLAES